jgi:hypothetical protein
MRHQATTRSLLVTSLAALAAAVALSIPVAERLLGAVWQWYKFAGHGDDGHITLSLRTGLVFTALLAATFCSALGVNRIARHRQATYAAAWSYRAMSVATLATAAYWLLGMSSLNVWRP